MVTQKLIDNLLQIPAESQTLEFKLLESRGAVAKVVQTAVAMTNTSGGLIVLGIDDPEKTKLEGSDRIKGIDNRLELLDEIVRQLGETKPVIGNLGGPMVVADRASGRQIGLLSIPKATESLHSFHGLVYIRLQRGNTVLSPSEIVNSTTLKDSKRPTRSWSRSISGCLKLIIISLGGRIARFGAASRAPCLKSAWPAGLAAGPDRHWRPFFCLPTTPAG